LRRAYGTMLNNVTRRGMKDDPEQVFETEMSLCDLTRQSGLRYNGQ